MIFLGKHVHPGCDPFVVAEISGNHGGSFAVACELIAAARDAGADAVKFQCYEPDDLTINNGYVIGGGTPWEGQTLYELYKEACTPLDWMQPLFEQAKHEGIAAFSSVYSERGLELLEKLGCPAYKIASYENNDPLFVKKVVNTGKPVVISTGMMGEDQETRLMAVVDYDKTILLHCISKYPVELNELGLQAMLDLMNTYEPTIPVGFSCHTDNPLAMAAAVTLGACMVEVHLTLDNPESPDYEFSFVPEHLAKSIAWCKQLHQGTKYLPHTAEKAAKEFRRSLHIVKDIFKDEVFTEQHIKSCRPATGCSPHLLPNIIGRKAKQTLRAYTPMDMEYVE